MEFSGILMKTLQCQVYKNLLTVKILRLSIIGPMATYDLLVERINPVKTSTMVDIRHRTTINILNYKPIIFHQ